MIKKLGCPNKIQFVLGDIKDNLGKIDDKWLPDLRYKVRTFVQELLRKYEKI